ncbi:MAG: hypothetical protein VZR95_01340 [Alphaproteobacteria bacterium]
MSNNTVIKHSKTIKLFGILPIYGWSTRGGRKTWTVLGLPVFKRRRFENKITTKYYIFGIIALKISRKSITV